MRRLALAAATALAAAVPAPQAAAQPDPTFRSSCGELRDRLARLPKTDDLVVIQVDATIRAKGGNEAVAYLVVCGPPDPQVACITYTVAERAVGDRVIVSGGYTGMQDDKVVLDPCLHVTPDGPAR